MKELSRIASAIAPSKTLAINNLYKQLKAEGKDALGFGVGEPDFNTPEHIKAAGIRAIEENQTRYTAASGTQELKEAICQRMQEDFGLTYTPAEIAVASGAKHSLYIALQCLLNPGDEVILPAPYWVSYIEMIRMCGAVPVVVNTTHEEDFKVTPEKLRAAVTGRTKAIILNNPSNPTGMIYSREELQALCDICVENDLYIVADEIYYCLVYDHKPFTSVASLGDEVRARTVLVNGVSKAYAMTGWRIGYSAAPAHITKIISNYVGHSTAAPSTISQAAAAEAFRGSQESVYQMREAFEQRRNYMVERMNAIAHISCLKPEGAFYVMMNLQEIFGHTIRGHKIETSEDFASAFVQEEMVATVPGSAFGADQYIRWSYATDMDTIRKAMDRLERFVADMK